MCCILNFTNTKALLGPLIFCPPFFHANRVFPVSQVSRYQFSLFYFVRLFKTCMDKAAKSDAPQWLLDVGNGPLKPWWRAPCCFNTPQRLRWWYWYPYDQLGQPDLVWNLPECVQRRHGVHLWTRDRASFCRDSCSEHQEALWFMHTSRCSELWLRNVEEFKGCHCLEQTSGISTRQTAEILLVMAGVMRETS